MEDRSDKDETGDSDVATVSGGLRPEMSDEEKKCYHNYMNKKLEEYEPIWVS